MYGGLFQFFSFIFPFAGYFTFQNPLQAGYIDIHMGVEAKIGVKPPKMDGL